MSPLSRLLIQIAADFIQDWREKSACEGHYTLFYPPVDHRGNQTESDTEREKRENRAKSLCAGCPVRHACREDALNVTAKSNIHGIRGGLGEDQLRALYTMRAANRKGKD